jgi:tetratricopeptide (TPR) repeat protein
MANAYNNLAMVQIKQGRFKKALANLKRTLKIELPIENTAAIATTYNNTAGVYHEKGDVTNAKRFYEKTLTTARIAFSEGHPSVTLYENNLQKLLAKSFQDFNVKHDITAAVVCKGT